jgi:hypothetical protein
MWVASKALGLHPWHPDIQKLNFTQLHWALVQDQPERREDFKQLMLQRGTGPALEFISWFDSHVS